jgi:regulator of cell morphogenesis and NO signaling
MTIDPDRSIGDLAGERLGRIEVLERHGIDYCCGGPATLAEACRKAGCEPRDVVADLERSDREATSAPAAATRDWRAASLTDLTDHIVAEHHAFMKRELPRLGDLLAKVLAAHGERHPELRDVARVYRGLRDEIEAHLGKEEQVLFPLIQQMERTGEAGRAHCGSVENPIAVMEREHASAGEALATLRRLTGGYAMPADGCATYRALLEGLAAMERDLHEHIHKENNILHPRAARLEASLLIAARRKSRWRGPSNSEQ